jgi:hypothetical protein
MKEGVQPQHRNICRRLFQAGMLPRSECGQSLVRVLKPLLDSGVLRWEKAAGGQRLAVVNQPAFERWFSQHFPNAQLQAGVDSSRIQAVAQFRNTKALRSNLPEIVCLRSTRDGVLLRDGVPVETTRATNEHGAFAFTLTDPTPYALRGNCALIENLAVFHSFERLELEAVLAIWTGGISSNRFIDWLAANVKHGLRVLHLPDYDPVGLTEFLRHHERLGEAVTLFLPDDLPALFRRHSNPSLLADQKNQRMLMELRKARHPAVRQIVALIDECNGGLEQEAIFIVAKQILQRKS